MEWTNMIIPVVSSSAMTFSVMPLFIDIFGRSNLDKRFVKKDRNGTMPKLEPRPWRRCFSSSNPVDRHLGSGLAKPVDLTLFILLFIMGLYGALGL